VKIGITGANGFIGQYVVEQALADGHEVLAIVRSSVTPIWKKRENLSVIACDLSRAHDLHEKIAGCDVVIHLAAITSGDNQYAETLKATETVLAAMNRAAVKRLVGLSSISVLDYINQKPMSSIDETTSINKRDQELGPYAIMKRDQEALFEKWKDPEKNLVIIRPGIVYSKNKLSTAHVGPMKGKHGIAAMHKGEIPVVEVRSVAKALVTAATSSLNNEVIHLVNDDLPTQSDYIQSLKSQGELAALIPLPWRLCWLLAASIRPPLRAINKVPDVLRRNSVAARLKPFTFSNEKAKNLLNWQPGHSLN